MAYWSMTLADAFGRETSKRIECKAQATIAEYNAVGTALIAALEAITDLAIVRCDLVLNNELSLSGTPAEGSNVDVGATFVAELAGEANRKASHKVPGIKMEYVGTQGTIDPDQADVVTYLAMFLETTGDLLISDGEEVGDWMRGSLDR